MIVQFATINNITLLTELNTFTVVLSFWAAVLGSYSAMQVINRLLHVYQLIISINADRVIKTYKPSFNSPTWTILYIYYQINKDVILGLFLASVLLAGCGIWAMHFVGMYSLELSYLAPLGTTQDKFLLQDVKEIAYNGTTFQGLKVPVSYDIGFTLLSLIFAIAGLFVGILITAYGAGLLHTRMDTKGLPPIRFRRTGSQSKSENTRPTGSTSQYRGNLSITGPKITKGKPVLASVVEASNGNVLPANVNPASTDANPNPNPNPSTEAAKAPPIVVVENVDIQSDTESVARSRMSSAASNHPLQELNNLGEAIAQNTANPRKLSVSELEEGKPSEGNEDTLGEVLDLQKVNFFDLSLRRRFFFVLGGCLTGAGVAVMHYSGLAAMRYQFIEVRYNVGIIILSIVIAMVVSLIAMWIIFFLKQKTARFLAPIIMGVAVCGMHYTGMLAYTYYPTDALSGVDAFVVPSGSFSGNYFEMAVSHFAFSLELVIVIFSKKILVAR